MDFLVDKVYEAVEFYEWCLTRADKRVEKWFLMDNYSTTWILTGLYLLIILQGKKVMRNRQALEFPKLLFVYNMALVALNFHIFYELFSNSLRLNYSYTCQPVDYSDNPYEMRIAKALWWYYFSKCIEFLDTFFFVLRKKNNQISFLHVYHHATMFPIWWIGVKFVPGGQSFFGAMINSFIHVVMYTYYGVSALGPEYQKYLWWKKYLTRLQLLQFLVGMAYSAQSIVFGCRAAPLFMSWFWLLYGLSLIALFLNFYNRAYILPSTQAKCVENNSNGATPSTTSNSVKVQFVAGMSHAAFSLLQDCNFPRWMQWALILYGLSILLLFLNFYYHAYIEQSKKLRNRKAQSNGHVETNGHVANGHNKKSQ